MTPMAETAVRATAAPRKRSWLLSIVPHRHGCELCLVADLGEKDNAESCHQYAPVHEASAGFEVSISGLPWNCRLPIANADCQCRLPNADYCCGRTRSEV